MRLAQSELIRLEGWADGGPGRVTPSLAISDAKPDAKSQKFPVVSSLTRLATAQQAADTSSRHIRIGLTGLNRLKALKQNDRQSHEKRSADRSGIDETRRPRPEGRRRPPRARASIPAEGIDDASKAI